MHPITKIIVHQSENRKKCSVEPLRKIDGFLFYTFPLSQNIGLENYIRLGIGGRELTPDDSDKGLLVLDSTWRYVSDMETSFNHVPVRSLSGWKTAYPRVSKIYDDPETGLATVEAIYTAFFILGRNTNGILDEYFWKDKFFHINKMLMNK